MGWGGSSCRALKAILRFERLSMNRSRFCSSPREGSEEREAGTPPLEKRPPWHPVIGMLLTYKKLFLVTTESEIGQLPKCVSRVARFCLSKGSDCLRACSSKWGTRFPVGVVTQQNPLIDRIKLAYPHGI